MRRVNILLQCEACCYEAIFEGSRFAVCVLSYHLVNSLGKVSNAWWDNLVLTCESCLSCSQIVSPCCSTCKFKNKKC